MLVRFSGRRRLILSIIVGYALVFAIVQDRLNKPTVVSNKQFSGVSSVYERFKDSLPPLKFYKYNTTDFDPQFIKTTKIPFPRKKYVVEAFEQIVYEALEGSEFLVSDPEKADLFYAKIYLSTPPYPKVGSILLPYLQTNWPYFNRSRGVDHVLIHMIFCVNRFSINMREQRLLPCSLTLPDVLWNWVVDNQRAAMKFTIVPYGSITEPIFDYKPKNISAFFIGTLTPSFGSKTGPRVRKQMAPVVSQIRDASVIATSRWGKKNKQIWSYNFTDLVRRSNFCIVPYGDSPSSKRLFDALRSGCIPIVLSDEIRYPFEGVFGNWRNCVLQVPMYSPEMVEQTMMLANERWTSVLREAAKDVFPLTELSLEAKIIPGQQIANWMWCEYFKACTVAVVKRALLLKCKYM